MASISGLPIYCISRYRTKQTVRPIPEAADHMFSCPSAARAFDPGNTSAGQQDHKLDYSGKSKLSCHLTPCMTVPQSIMCWVLLRPSVNTTDPLRWPIRFDPTPAQTDQRDPSRSAWRFMFRDYLHSDCTPPFCFFNYDIAT